VKSAFFGLCVNAGKQVLAAMMEADRVALCGPKGRPDADRRALRGGHTPSWLTLGGRRMAVRRPRARSVGGEELSLPSFGWAEKRDPRMRRRRAIAAGVSNRRYAGTLMRCPQASRGRKRGVAAVAPPPQPGAPRGGWRSLTGCRSRRRHSPESIACRSVSIPREGSTSWGFARAAPRTRP
jgi:hypothetical protein